MNLLIIGGTQFVGRHLAQEAVARGHTVTLFNRGQTNPAKVPGVETLIGDRKGDLSPLAGHSWDAVIDTCAYLPADVARMAQALQDSARTYVLVSSISVYASFVSPNSESSPVGSIDDVDTQTVDGRTYGPLKALCEAAVQARFGADRTLMVRPGLIVGPYDPTQRFTYWPARVSRAVDHERVVAPGSPTDPIQCIDARDLSAFVLQALEASRTGTFNVTSPPGQWTMGELLHCCARVSGCNPDWSWVNAAAAERQNLAPWSDLPVWVPALGDHAAFMQTDVSQAIDAGLRMRPLLDTVRDTLAWWQSLPQEARAFTKAGLTEPREMEVLQKLAESSP